MRKITSLICVLFLLLTVVSIPAAFAMDVDYSGTWNCMYVDMGDGELLSEFQGQNLQEALQMQLNEDGSFVLNSFGELQEGTWQPTGAGIAVIVDNEVVAFTYKDDMLENTEDGVTMYFGRAEDTPKQGGFSTLLNLGQADDTPSFSFAGTWKATAYEVSGVSYDIDMFFPDGITIILAEDGTAVLQLTPDYAENITWTETDDGIEINGSYVLYDPAWDPDTGTLAIYYAADTVQIIFEKADAAETPDTPPAASMLPQVYTCDFFSIAFPENWEQNKYNTYDWDDTFAVGYDLNDEDGWSISSVTLTVSIEKVAAYRDQIDTLMEYATAAGKEALDEITVGGLTLLGTEYEDYWSYAAYAARVPEASVTVLISVSDPDEIRDVLPDILQSIMFTYPIPDTPYVDPPLPQDGAAFIPSLTAITVGEYDLQAEWLTDGTSIIPKDVYNNSVAIIEDTVYVLTGKKLLTFTRDGAALTSAGDPLDLGDVYSQLTASWDGTLYIMDGFYQALSFKDGATDAFDLDGYLTMSPDGQWGLSYRSSDTVTKITFTEDGMATKDWVLKDLSDDEARQGRFSYVDTILITADHIFVAGTDASTDYATRIAMYDLEGNELAVFGGTEWSDDSTFGSVTGIVQTNNGIIVQDGLYENYKLFALDGTFLGMADCDDLLGTDGPWPIELIASENGAIAIMTQERDDESAVELLIFEITGF